MKDCVQLLHLWLAKRELESRRVKDRDFKGVDIRELDLLPSFYHWRKYIGKTALTIVLFRYNHIQTFLISRAGLLDIYDDIWSAPHLPLIRTVIKQVLQSKGTIERVSKVGATGDDLVYYTIQKGCKPPSVHAFLAHCIAYIITYLCSITHPLATQLVFENSKDNGPWNMGNPKVVSSSQRITPFSKNLISFHSYRLTIGRVVVTSTSSNNGIY